MTDPSTPSHTLSEPALVKEISVHLVKVFDGFRAHATWTSSAEVADRTGVSPRTARHLAAKLHEAGALDRIEVFPGHRFRPSTTAQDRAGDLIRRIEEAREAFGLAATA